MAAGIGWGGHGFNFQGQGQRPRWIVGIYALTILGDAGLEIVSIEVTGGE